ncbi:MAG: hypothetical protein IPH07_29805 [Deltaproteobacteria bacterium]|nr:hypothetical protein [Deltaproteobacteria bacterium]MBK8715107.1 hypothetical protein [Deltaproteobacteria bacterium]MBP7287125.1 hypothetical protein [Nannocystaceae bacterium]
MSKPAVVAAGCVAAALAIGATGCAREPEGRFAQTEEDPPTKPDGPLRYAETIAKARRGDDVIEPLLELGRGNKGELQAVVAVVHVDGSAAIELWRFDQSGSTQVLEPRGEPAPLLRLDTNATASAALPEFRLALASPGAELHRRFGMPAAPGQAEAIEQGLVALAQAAVAARAAGSTAQARVQALAQVFHALDDGPLFTRDQLGLALDALAAGRWRATEIQRPSDRRAVVRTEGGDTLELLRKGDGWVITTIREGAPTPPLAPATP